uniref:Uncharacterized protein n=1 Tax=Arundo donax TaxID=35708 RepID=A0A0A9G0P1_ARUDO
MLLLQHRPRVGILRQSSQIWFTSTFPAARHVTSAPPPSDPPPSATSGEDGGPRASGAVQGPRGRLAGGDVMTGTLRSCNDPAGLWLAGTARRPQGRLTAGPRDGLVGGPRAASCPPQASGFNSLLAGRYHCLVISCCHHHVTSRRLPALIPDADGWTTIINRWL